MRRILVVWFWFMFEDDWSSNSIFSDGSVQIEALALVALVLIFNSVVSPSKQALPRSSLDMDLRIRNWLITPYDDGSPSSSGFGPPDGVNSSSIDACMMVLFTYFKHAVTLCRVPNNYSSLAWFLSMGDEVFKACYAELAIILNRASKGLMKSKGATLWSPFKQPILKT